MTDNTKRFSNRVDDYVKYRPNYPDNLVQTLEEMMPIHSSTIVADVGSGTGISSLPFLKKGYTVMSVEPNTEMREAAEQILSCYARFTSVDGSAEQTTLPDNSIDLIFCGQAFHWFDKEKSKQEFNRVLQQKGNMVLAWNERSVNSEFQQEYEQILYANIDEYKFVNHRNIDENIIAAFFSPKALHKIQLANHQVLDFAGLVGRLRSSSYCPVSGEIYNKLLHEVRILFDRHQREGMIVFEYGTQIYWC